jgi:hypothetical protein
MPFIPNDWWFLHPATLAVSAAPAAGRTSFPATLPPVAC